METKSTHAPGPWNVERPYQEPGVYVAMPNTGLVCRLYKPDAGMFVGDKTVTIDANAALIAAAPELLAACRTALSLIKAYWVEEHGNPVVGLAWGEIERAIAKAEGR